MPTIPPSSDKKHGCIVCVPFPNSIIVTAVLASNSGSSVMKNLGPTCSWQLPPSIENPMNKESPSAKASALNVTIQLGLKKRLLTVTKKSSSMGINVVEVVCFRPLWQTC